MSQPAASSSGTIYVVSVVGHGMLASDHSGSDADVQAAPAAKADLATHRNPAGPGAGDLSISAVGAKMLPGRPTGRRACCIQATHIRIAARWGLSPSHNHFFIGTSAPREIFRVSA